MEPKMWVLFIGLAALAGGVMSIGGAALNLDVFFNSPKAQPFVDALGRTGARVFYLVFGLFVAALGLGMTIYGVQLWQQGP
jgi:small neutral amino acid transporter SnatA (MarC family)